MRNVKIKRVTPSQCHIVVVLKIYTLFSKKISTKSASVGYKCEVKRCQKGYSRGNTRNVGGRTDKKPSRKSAARCRLTSFEENQLQGS